MAEPEVPDETTLLQDLRASTASLLADVNGAGWSDADTAAASVLPDWTRGHVLTHLARNADAVAGMLAAALRGETVPMYPSQQARNDDIEAGAGRSSLDLVTDLRDSAERLDRVLGAVADGEDWTLDCGADRDAGDVLLMRWCEVEIHRVDLGLSTPADWPSQFVARVLPMVADPAVLFRRVDRPLRLTIQPGGPATEFDGTVWAAAPTGDDRDPVAVTGEDWAVLAWLTGRASPAETDGEVVMSGWRLFPA